MKKIFYLFAALTLSGCATTVPVTAKFPAVPADLMTTCPDLKEQQATTKLSDVLSTVTENYGKYHECQTKVDSWIEWYKGQKTIFESVK